jgi:hypothetical protein
MFLSHSHLKTIGIGSELSDQSATIIQNIGVWNSYAECHWMLVGHLRYKNQGIFVLGLRLGLGLDLQLPIQSVPINTKVVNSNLAHDKVYSI